MTSTINIMARKKIPAVYLIEDESTGRVYVGSTADIATRLYKHSWLLDNHRHYNARLQRAFNEGRQLSITYHPLSTEEDALLAEQTILDKFAGSGLLYNIALCAVAPMRGRKASEATKEKMRRSMTGFKHSEETRKLLSRLAMERGMPQATLEAGAAARRGKKLSPEHVEKVRRSSTERMTPEAREHLRRINLGVKHTASDVEKMTALIREKVAKPVVAAGERYEALIDAQKALRIGPQTLRARLIDTTGEYPDYFFINSHDADFDYDQGSLPHSANATDEPQPLVDKPTGSTTP